MRKPTNYLVAAVIIYLSVMTTGNFITSIRAQVAQPATAVQQTATRADAAAAWSTIAGVSSGTNTLTLTPNGGESIYIYGIDIQNCAGASAVTAANTTTITTTNISGSPIWNIGSGVTAGLCTQSFAVPVQTGLKSQTPGTAVTFVVPQVATNQGIRLNVAWRSAPILLLVPFLSF